MNNNKKGATLEDLKRLANPSILEELEILPGWYPQSTKGGEAICVPYFNSRDIQRILDYCLGEDNWTSEFTEIKGNLFCRITVNMEDGTVVYREDVGTESNMSPEKGEASDAFKRAATMLGVRFAYEMGNKKFRMDGALIIIKDNIKIDKRDTTSLSLYCNGLNSKLGLLSRLYNSSREEKPEEVMQAFATLKQYYNV